MDGSRGPARSLAIVAGIVVLVLLVWLGRRDRDAPSATDSTPAALAGTPGPVETSQDGAQTSDRPRVAPIDGCDLLTPDEVEAALGLLELHVANRTVARFTGSEACTWRPHVRGDFAEDKLLQIAPGDPADFEPGAALDGVIGRPVTGVGEAAVWFGRPQGGAISVYHAANYGDLYVRLAIARPDIDDAGRLEVARRLVASALSRFPGEQPASTPAPPDPAFTAALNATFDAEEEPVDRSGVSYVDNLLAKEEAGEWTRGEGLLATLRLLTGEVESREVLRHGEVQQQESTGLLRMAAEYLESDEAGTDPSTAAEIERLRDALVWTNEELEAMAGIGPDSSARRERLISLPATQTPCADFFYGADTPGVGPCIEWRPVQVGPTLHRVFVPAPDQPQGGWTEADYDLGVEALDTSARWFQDHGSLPPVNLVFSVTNNPGSLAQAVNAFGFPCGVVLYPRLRATSDAAFRQVVAHEIAHCFQQETFPDQNFSYPVTRWREEGLAEYLSNRVYPHVNLEWSVFGENETLRRTNTILDLAYANGLFFQYLESEVGLNGVFALVMTLPTSGGRADQEANLARYPNIDEIFLRFVETAVDGRIIDTGGGAIPFKMSYPTIRVTAPVTRDLDFKPFGVSRGQFMVEECKRAHFRFESEVVRDGARADSKLSWVELPPAIPLSPSDDHDRIFIGTSAGEETVTLDIYQVDDDPECEDETDSPPPEPEDCRCPVGSRYFR